MWCMRRKGGEKGRYADDGVTVYGGTTYGVIVAIRDPRPAGVNAEVNSVIEWSDTVNVDNVLAVWEISREGNRPLFG